MLLPSSYTLDNEGDGGVALVPHALASRLALSDSSHLSEMPVKFCGVTCRPGGGGYGGAIQFNRHSDADCNRQVARAAAAFPSVGGSSSGTKILELSVLSRRHTGELVGWKTSCWEVQTAALVARARRRASHREHLCLDAVAEVQTCTRRDG